MLSLHVYDVDNRLLEIEAPAQQKVCCFMTLKQIADASNIGMNMCIHIWLLKKSDGSEEIVRSSMSIEQCVAEGYVLIISTDKKYNRKCRLCIESLNFHYHQYTGDPRAQPADDIKLEENLIVLSPFQHSKTVAEITLPADSLVESPEILELIAGSFNLTPKMSLHICIISLNEQMGGILDDLTVAMCQFYSLKIYTSLVRDRIIPCPWCQKSATVHRLSKKQKKDKIQRSDSLKPIPLASANEEYSENYGNESGPPPNDLPSSLPAEETPTTEQLTANLSRVRPSSLSSKHSGESESLQAAYLALASGPRSPSYLQLANLIKQSVNEAIAPLTSNIRIMKGQISTIRNELSTLKKNIKKEIKNEINNEVSTLKKEIISTLKKEISFIHNELSFQFEVISSDRFIAKTKLAISEILIVSECRKKQFPSNEASVGFREAISKFPPGNPQLPFGSYQNEYTQLDPRISSKAGHAEADLFFKYFSPAPLWSSQFTWQSPQASPTENQAPSLHNATNTISTTKINQKRRVFSGCAIAKVCRSTDLRPAKFEMSDRSFVKLAFKIVQLERVVTACNGYYTGNTPRGCPPVQFAAIVSPSFLHITGSEANDLLNGVLGFFGTDALPFLNDLFTHDRLLLI